LKKKFQGGDQWHCAALYATSARPFTVGLKRAFKKKSPTPDWGGRMGNLSYIRKALKAGEKGKRPAKTVQE